MHVVGQDVSGGAVYRLAATHPENVISLTAIESALAGFGAERLADVTRGGAWYIGALAAPGVASLLFEKEARAFVGEYLYPLYGVPPTAVSPEDVTEFARTYGRPGGFSGAAGLYRAMLTEGEELRALAQYKPLQMPVTTIGSRGGGFTYAAFRGITAQEVTAIQLDGVGHYVAQEAPHLLADRLLEVLATSAPSSLNETPLPGSHPDDVREPGFGGERSEAGVDVEAVGGERVNAPAGAERGPQFTLADAAGAPVAGLAVAEAHEVKVAAHAQG